MRPAVNDVPRSRISAAATGVLALLALGVLGVQVFTGAPPLLTFAPVCGILAALITRRPLDAALVAAVGSAAGSAALFGLSSLGWRFLTVWPAFVPGVIAVSAAVAAGGALAMRSASLHRILFAGAVLLVVLAAWDGGLGRATTPAADGSTVLSLHAGTPALGPDTRDEQVYLLTVRRLQSGQPYYPAVRDTLLAANEVRGGKVDPASPLSYRPPTLYWLLSKLPDDPMSLVIATLAFGTLVAGAATLLAATFVEPPLALLAGVAVLGLYVGEVLGATLLYAEAWAGGLALVGIALLALDRGRRVGAATWGAVTFVLAAALMRELAVAFLLLGLAAAVFVPAQRARRGWLPWAVGLAAWACLFGLHVAAVRAAVAGVAPVAADAAVPWLHPDGLGLVAGLTRLSRDLAVQQPVAWLLLAFAALGALLAPRERLMRVMLAGTVLGGAAVVAILHPPGVTDTPGLPPGYWLAVVLPVLLACTPLAFALLPGARARAIEPERTTDAPEAPAEGIAV